MSWKQFFFFNFFNIRHPALIMFDQESSDLSSMDSYLGHWACSSASLTFDFWISIVPSIIMSSPLRLFWMGCFTWWGVFTFCVCVRCWWYFMAGWSCCFLNNLVWKSVFKHKCWVLLGLSSFLFASFSVLLDVSLLIGQFSEIFD